jgi:two-component sensor histidine kinase
MIYIANGLENHLNTIGDLNSGMIVIAILEILFAFGLVIYIMNQYQIYQSYARLQVTKLNLHLEQQNEAVVAKNKENVTLVKEIHHRVKNNLQIIISLLRMQRSEIKSKENKQYFDDMINRIMTMSMIHQRLYQEKEMTRINLKEYLTELCDEVTSLGSQNENIKINVRTEVKLVDLKTIVPLGLLINELVSNSSKHAFDSEGSHSIDIEIIETTDGFNLKYGDSGEWKDNFEPTGFGIELIDVLTEQLNGTNKRSGTTYQFELHPFED